MDDDIVDGYQNSLITLSIDDANSDDLYDTLGDETIIVTTTDDDGVPGNVDGDTDFDANDSFLIHLVNLSGTDLQIEQSRGSSQLAATQIRANVNALGGGSAASQGMANGS